MSSGLTVAAALDLALARGLDHIDARLLLGEACGQTRTWLITHEAAELSTTQATRFDAWCQRRAGGEPVAYLLGRREFHGLMLAVTPDVLVPRPDTETLVDWALALLVQDLADRHAPAVLDLGTGSGAVALALRHHHEAACVTAVDASAAALAVARSNGERLGLPVDWRLGSWWQPVADARFDLVLSNPPYIAEDDSHLAALSHEPFPALAAGGEGPAPLREVNAGAAAPPAPRGREA